MENFIIAFNAVLPFIIYLALGYYIRASGIATIDLLRGMNQISYKILFPILLFYNIYQSEGLLSGNKAFMLYVVAVVTVLFLVLFFIVPRIVKDNGKRGVLIQGILRSNITLFSLPLAESILGDEGVAVASLLIAFVIAFYNVYSVIALETFRGGHASVGKVLLEVIKNPLLIGVAAGLAFNLLHIPIPGNLLTPIGKVAAMTSPLALIILGGTLEFSAAKQNLKYIVSAIAIKMVLLPAICVPIAHALGFSPAEIFGAYCLVGTPIATGTYAMAAGMGGDAELAGQLVVFSTAASLFTIFLGVLALKTLGWV